MSINWLKPPSADDNSRYILGSDPSGGEDVGNEFQVCGFADCQGIGRDVPRSQPGPPMGNPFIGPILRGYLWVILPEESLDAGTLEMVFIGSQSPFNGLDPRGVKQPGYLYHPKGRDGIPEIP